MIVIDKLLLLLASDWCTIEVSYQSIGSSFELINHCQRLDVSLVGVIAQLVEHLVRNEKVRGSNPLGSTILNQSRNFGLEM